MFKRILTYSILSLIALGGFFGNVDIETKINNNNPAFVVTIEGTYTYATEPDPSPNETAKFARQGTPENKTTTSASQLKTWNDIIDAINLAFMVLSTLISPIILFVGWLMSPDWTSGDLFGLRSPMYALWVTVSNIVYFIYAILLILIALGTMFGQDKFSYKVMLPKLALGILMVPFTWWFVQWTISIASVVTASVMTIPLETLEKSESKWFNETRTIPKEIKINSTNKGGSISDAIKNCKKDPKTCSTPQEFLKGVGGMYGPLVVYAYSVFDVQELTHLPTGLDMASTALSIVHQSFIGVLMFLVFGLLVLALTTILLVRAIKLWMYAIFAPLFTFRFVAGSNLLGGDDDSFSIKEFIGLAFVPAIIGLTLSFGLILISAVQSTTNSANGGSKQTCDLTQKDNCKIHIMSSTENYITRNWIKPTDGEGDKKNYETVTTFRWGEMNFIFEGKATNQSQSETQSKATGVLDSIGGMFGTVIVDIIALVFIWMSFMAAKNISKAVKAAVEPFEKIGQQVGGLAKSLPKYTPLPIPGGSISGLNHTMDLSKSKFESAMKGREEEKIGRFAPGLIADTIKAKDLEKLTNEFGKVTTINSGNSRDIANAIGAATLAGKAMKVNMDNVSTITKGKVTDDTIKYLFDEKKVTDPHEKDIIKALLTGKKDTLNSADAEKGWKILQSWGSASGTNAGPSGTTPLNATGDGKLSLGGININLNGANLSKHDELATKIITGVNGKASTMIKPTLDEIKKELEAIGLAEKVEEVAKKIETGIDKFTFKTKP